MCVAWLGNVSVATGALLCRKPRRERSVGIKRPTLKDMVLRAQNGPTGRAEHGPVRARLQCHHPGNRRYLVGEVRGNAILGMDSPHDLPNDVAKANYEIYMSCNVCKSLFMLDMSKVRAELGKPGHLPRKIDISLVSRVVPR